MKDTAEHPDLPDFSALRDAAGKAGAWPFVEARKLIARVARVARSGRDEVLFETGYGPSGLPHIGTFGEVARTTMVRHAFHVLTEGRIRTRLLAFPTTWTGCARCLTTCPTSTCWRNTLASR